MLNLTLKNGMRYSPVTSIRYDEYFDFTEKEGKTVKVEKAELPLGTSAEEILGQIKVRSVADSYSVN